MRNQPGFMNTPWFNSLEFLKQKFFQNKNVDSIAGHLVDRFSRRPKENTICPRNLVAPNKHVLAHKCKLQIKG